LSELFVDKNVCIETPQDVMFWGVFCRCSWENGLSAKAPEWSTTIRRCGSKSNNYIKLNSRNFFT